jgi:hypothetical protein
MLIPILRSGALYILWRRHIRQRAFGGVIAVLGVLAVNLIHSEALAFFTATDRINLAPIAFYIRWLGWLTAGIAYLWFVERKIAKASKAARSKNDGSAKAQRFKAKSSPPKPVEHNDGFDALRHNRPLRSRADTMLERKKRENRD